VKTSPYPSGEVLVPTTDRESPAPASLVLQTEPQCAKGGGQQDTKVALPPAFHAVTLTADEAATIRQLLDDPAQPAQAGAEMPTADASLLLGGDR
jgi:hypothetical protein